MMQTKKLEFISSFCKQGSHLQCHGSWTGLGFIINCNCSCHEQKQKAMVESTGPEASTLGVPS
jgi:hypothetical protein